MGASKSLSLLHCLMMVVGFFFFFLSNLSLSHYCCCLLHPLLCWEDNKWRDKRPVAFSLATRFTHTYTHAIGLLFGWLVGPSFGRVHHYLSGQQQTKNQGKIMEHVSPNWETRPYSDGLLFTPPSSTINPSQNHSTKSSRLTYAGVRRFPALGRVLSQLVLGIHKQVFTVCRKINKNIIDNCMWQGKKKQRQQMVFDPGLSVTFCSRNVWKDGGVWLTLLTSIMLVVR